MTARARNSGRPVRVLIAEDVSDDAELLLRELRRGGFEPRYRIITSADDFIEALEQQEWDLILCDYTMPGFTGTDALSLLRRRGLDIPFIFVSGTLDEETAVAAMRAGAQDYVVKDNLKRLVPAIERELRDAELRRDHARAEAERQSAETRFREILAMAPDAIVVTDEKQRITVFNRAAEVLFGHTVEDVTGQPVNLLFSAEIAEEQREFLIEFAEAPETHRDAMAKDWLQGRRKNGDEFPIEISVSKIVEDGVAIFLAIVRDLSHRKHLEEQLRQSQKMEAVGQLTGGLAHDFNNLLTVIIGNLDLLQEEVGENSKACGMAQSALEASLRGAQLTRQLLAFSRRQPLESKVFDLNGLVTGTTELLRRTLGGQIEVSMHLADDLGLAVADQAQVEAALINLAVNARDAMPDGGRLTIETANKSLGEQYAAENAEVTPGNYLMLAVSDTGNGIPQDLLDRVFEPFFTTKKTGQGTGLGLSMVYGFVKQSGGHVKIYSEAGYGTTVRIYLPRADAGQKVEVSGSMEPTEPRGRSARILVVDDTEAVRELAVLQLVALGYTVFEAEDAATALDLLTREGPFDLLFTDVVMPGAHSGAELAREARMRQPGLKVLFTSGFAETSVRRDEKFGEVSPLLSKPYRDRDLALKVSEILHKEEPES